MVRPLTRRQLLTYSLLGGVTATGIHEFFRLRALGKQKSVLAELFLRSPEYIEQSLSSALNSDREAAAAGEKSQASLNLTPPTLPYNRDISKQLIQCSRITTEQYLFGKYKPDYEGGIQTLPTYTDRLSSYTQVASILGPEDAEVSENVEVPDDITTTLPFSDPLREQLDIVEKIVKQVAGQVVSVRWQIPVYWGFVLASDQGNLIVFRGTQQTNEWVQNLTAFQLDYTRDKHSFEFSGKVHEGFANLYSKIAEPVIEAAKRLSPSVPCYISGHSLGAALATLAAMDIAIRVPGLKNQVQLYTYASPRVGDPAFVAAHSRLVPNSYRVANLGDAFPLLPLPTIRQLVYTHLGQEWAFLTQTQDFGPNHFVSTYQKAIEQELETNRTRKYPISAVD